MNKSIILIAVFLIESVLFAYTSEQAYEVSSYLVDRFKSAGDWVDNLQISSDEEIEVEFPTAESLFACEFPSNSLGAALTVSERKQAFDQFLLEMSRTNGVTATKAYRSTCLYALVFCADRGYTTGLCAATNILSGSEGGLRPNAYAVLRRLACPSVEMSAYVYTLLTNQTRYSAYDRNGLFNDYANRLKCSDSIDNVVLTNGISMLREASSFVRTRIALDELMAHRLPAYSTSSNRLAYALAVLALPSLSARESEYFVAVTNDLHGVLGR